MTQKEKPKSGVSKAEIGTLFYLWNEDIVYLYYIIMEVAMITKQQARELSLAVGLDGETTKEIVELGNVLTKICKDTDATFHVTENRIWFTGAVNHPYIPSGKQIHSTRREEQSIEGQLVIDTYLYAQVGSVYLEQWGSSDRKSSLISRLCLTKEEIIELGEKAKTITAYDQSTKFDSTVSEMFGD